jgi:hypothetical protein
VNVGPSAEDVAPMQVGCRLDPRLWNLRLDRQGFCGVPNLHLTPAGGWMTMLGFAFHIAPLTR